MANTSKHEAHDVHQAARRMVRGLVRRAAEGDTFALEALADLEAELPHAVNLATNLMATGARMGETNRRAGYTFTELAAVLGTSRQAARQRAMRVVTIPATVLDYYRRPRA